MAGTRVGAVTAYRILMLKATDIAENNYKLKLKRNRSTKRIICYNESY